MSYGHIATCRRYSAPVEMPAPVGARPLHQMDNWWCLQFWKIVPLPDAGGTSAVTVPVALGGGGGGTSGLMGEARKEH